MSRFVLDCSLTMAWCFESEADAYTEAVLRSMSTRTAFVPALWPLEVANVLLVAERRQRVSAADRMRFLELLAGLPILVDPPMGVADIERLVSLGRQYGLSAYDAVYLHLAMRERLPLATHDRRLGAAGRAAGVPKVMAR